MSEQAKPTCPFCGAAVKPGWAGSVYWFDCGTMTDALDRDDREDQSTQCAQAERDRLAKELAEAQERIRRLEEAGDDAVALLDAIRPNTFAYDKWQKAKEAKP
jgi:hypothetical protein